jgi:hypothetical protein
MEKLNQILKELLWRWQVPERRPLLVQVMYVLIEDVDLNMYDKDTMEEIMYDLNQGTDQEVLDYLQVEPEELADALAPLKTEEEIRDYLMMEVLYEGILLNQPSFPHDPRLYE